MMLKLKYCRFIIVVLVCFVLSQTQGRAQEKPLKKIRWGVTSISASNWILMVVFGALALASGPTHGVDSLFATWDSLAPGMLFTTSLSSVLSNGSEG